MSDRSEIEAALDAVRAALPSSPSTRKKPVAAAIIALLAAVDDLDTRLRALEGK
jgi:hypothetical protein